MCDFYFVIFLFSRDYFEDCCHVKVPGRLFPIEEYYLEDILLDINVHSGRSKQNKQTTVVDLNFQTKKLKIEDDLEFLEEINDVIKEAFTNGAFDSVYDLLMDDEMDVNHQVRRQKS